MPWAAAQATALAIVRIGAYVREDAAGRRRGTSIAVQENHGLPTGHGVIGAECVGRGSSRDALLHGPQHRLIV